MTHPYTDEELDGLSGAKHAGTCAACRPVDPDNPTDEEHKALQTCPHCDKCTVVSVLSLGPVGTCSVCNQQKRISTDGFVIEPKCANCVIQNHHDNCRQLDDDGNLIACTADWPEGS
jgi:hypothetical protein